MNPNPHVLVLGAGIGGLSAAHELIERGFAVTVIEKRDVPGGKARSLLVPDSAVPPNRPLPGEHGFRFFPQFYRHIIDTMDRTPIGGGKVASSNLVYAGREMMALSGLPPITFPAHKPRTVDEFVADMVNALVNMGELRLAGLNESDFTFFADRLWRLMTTCPERALHEFEAQSWWHFMEADTHSTAFQQLFVIGLTRCLVAAKAEIANVRAGGVVLTQLMYASFSDAPSLDRLLDGPTSQVWINAWHDYLVGRGVVFQYGTTVTRIECDGEQITGVGTTEAGGRIRLQRADHYVCSLPVEYTGPLLTNEMIAAAPSLAGIRSIETNVRDMTGIQFYLSQDLPLVNGHILLVDSPWALTGISQRQFWNDIDFSHLGDGSVEGILSVDISDWNAEGTCVVDPDAPKKPGGQPTYKKAWQCTRDEVAFEVWTQLRHGLVQLDGSCPLPLQHPRYFIDPGMRFNPTPVSNDSRLFVNTVGSWQHRPEAATKMPNFFLASDYVRTNTNLATMESANEAARRAVNALIGAAGVNAPLCQVWPLPVPDTLAPYLLFDKTLWDQGKDWTGKRE